jgi:hypothetical protein
VYGRSSVQADSNAVVVQRRSAIAVTHCEATERGNVAGWTSNVSGVVSACITSILYYFLGCVCA